MILSMQDILELLLKLTLHNVLELEWECQKSQAVCLFMEPNILSMKSLNQVLDFSAM